MERLEEMDIKEKEKEQFGAISVQVPEEEWIKPKTDKAVQLL